MNLPLFFLKDIFVTFGGTPLFSDISLQIMEGDRVCLVGRNGSGKSTLMKVVQGIQELDGGERFTRPGVRIGYLPQNVIPIHGQKLQDFVLEGLPEEERTDENRYRADMVLSPLGLKPDKYMETLSGGKLRRAGLAQALVADPDILLLDEPTNHLDLNAIEWLEGYLQREFKGGLVCISHDRTFLTNISNKTFWLDRGQLRVNQKGYQDFERWSEEVMNDEEKRLERLGKKLEVENQWLAFGVTARRKRNQRRLGELFALRSKLKEERTGNAGLTSTIKLAPLTPELGSKMVLEMDGVCKTLDQRPPPKKVLHNFSTRILRKERIGVIGRNGAGKSTFLKLIVGQLEPDTGRIRRGKNLEITYFDQRREELKPNDTLWETLCPQGGDSVWVNGAQRHVVSYLKDFLFDAKQVKSPVGTLSGGECNRLLLAKKLANPGNLLILDEPTNDLDMDSLDVLQDVLSDYEGTLIIVSHDRDFLDRLVERTLVFEGEGVVEAYIGGYSDYLAQKKESAKTEKAKKTPAQAKVETMAEKKPPAKLSYKFQRELELLPGQIDTLMGEIDLLEASMADSSFYARDPEGFQKASNGLAEKKRQLHEAEERWLELEEMRLSLEL